MFIQNAAAMVTFLAYHFDHIARLCITALVPSASPYHIFKPLPYLATLIHQDIYGALASPTLPAFTTQQADSSSNIFISFPMLSFTQGKKYLAKDLYSCYFIHFQIPSRLTSAGMP